MLNGQRIREKAETRAAEIRGMVQNEGQSAFDLRADVRFEAAKCITKRTPYAGASLTAAVDHFVEHVLKYQAAPTVTTVIPGALVGSGPDPCQRTRAP